MSSGGPSCRLSNHPWLDPGRASAKQIIGLFQLRNQKPKEAKHRVAKSVGATEMARKEANCKAKSTSSYLMSFTILKLCETEAGED